MVYPENRLIVNGVDLTKKFKMVLADGYTLSPPSPKTYVVDIPGGNGKLDLTEALLGDTAYDNRSQEFIFYVIGVDDFEKLKTEVSNFLHGKDFDYVITMDPDYTYHGRFQVSEYTHGVYQVGTVGIIKITIDADPFKRKPTEVLKINAIGGTMLTIPSGRMTVKPTIETNGNLKVIYKNKLLELQKGTYVLNNVVFKQGNNKLYLNSYDIHNMSWGDLITNGVTWENFGGLPLYEWYKTNGDTTVSVMKTWRKLENNTWSSMRNSKWSDLSYDVDVTGKVQDVYIKYDWGDL